MKTRWGARVRLLQHRYQDATGSWRGGVIVSDRLGRRPGKSLFVAPRMLMASTIDVGASEASGAEAVIVPS